MPLTLIIIVITILLSMRAWNKKELMGKWIFNPYVIFNNKEYYRFISGGFIHANSMHLIFNMIALYFFGRNVEMVFGELFGAAGIIVFIVFYLLGIIISDIPTFLKHKDVPSYNSLGASGGVSALVFSSIMFFPLQKIYIMFIPIGIPGFILGTLYVIYSYYQGKQRGDNINHDAHLWGALFGIAFTIIAYPPVIGLFWDKISGFNFF